VTPRDPKDSDGNWGKMAVVGLEVPVGLLLGYFVGKWIGVHVGAELTGKWTGVCLGGAAGMYLLIKEALRSNRD
jgi:hypothetical protein